MKRLFAAMALAIPMALASVGTAQAEDAVGAYEVANVMNRADYASATEGVRFYFGNTAHPAVQRRVEADVTTSLRSRKFGRSNEEACQWVMMSALIQLRDHARAVGGNAVINVRSNWHNVEWSSPTQYQCAAGFLMAGVALKGDVVTLR